jgi:hypothetical protein
VSPALKKAYKRVLPDDDSERLSPEGQLALEMKRQQEVADALTRQEDQYLETVQRHRVHGLLGTLVPNAVVGQKVVAGGQDGSAKAYGEPAELAKRNKALVEKIKAVMLADPSLSVRHACELVAKQPATGRRRLSPRSLERIYRDWKDQ